MLRNRTTVKVQPGLFLQPYVVSQLSGAVVVAVVEGSEVTATEYALTSWLPIVGERDADGARAGSRPLADDGLGNGRPARAEEAGPPRPHPEDGRSYLLELTAAGKKTNERNGRRLSEAMQLRGD